MSVLYILFNIVKLWIYQSYPKLWIGFYLLSTEYNTSLQILNLFSGPKDPKNDYLIRGSEL